MNIIETEAQHTSGVYAKQPLVIVRGQGATLWDENNIAYLDCSSGHGVANLGHANPRVAAAIAEQAATLITLFDTFPNDKRAAVMEKLTSFTPGLERVFFCNSGTESVEAAFKFARISRAVPISPPPCAAFTAALSARFPRPGTTLPRTFRTAGPRLQPRALQQHRGLR
jgi:acetylornithine/succinyldiaminopimelate/putrescine aminotransferase